MHETRKAKLIHFLFLKSLNRVILISSIAALLLTGILALILNSQNKLSVIVLVNVLLVTLPLVLFILGIVCFALFSANLAKKKVLINKLSRFESLLKINVLCVEKENVITDSAFIIKKVIPLKTVATEQYVDQWLSNLLRATNDDGFLFDALNKRFDLELSAGVISVLSYNDNTKYSGASFKGGKTFVLGNPEFVPVKNRIGILKRCEDDIDKGCRILVLAEGKEQIGNDGYCGELEGIALIVLKEHIREDAFETFKWFKDNDIDIKVVSSDNPLITSVNAAEAGVEGADKYISLEGIDNIEDVISQYTVFGNATSEQKEAIITALKKENKVMVVGNDALMMKASNFAISMDEQKDADIVLDNSSLEPLHSVIDESKVFINNMQKILSLTLVKTVLAFILVLFFVLFDSSSKQCLFVFNHLLLWDLLTNGIAAFLFAFDKKNKQKTNVFKSAIPMMVLQILGVSTVFILYALQNNQLLSAGLYSIDNVAVICVFLFVVFGIVSLYSICAPLNNHRRLAFIIGASINVIALAVIILLSYLNVAKETPYLSMSGPAYFVAGIIAVIYSAIYLFANRIIGIIKGDNLENEN